MVIGVLDIQGSVEEHAAMLRRLSVEVVFVKTVAGLGRVQGLILPGGESTTIGKLLDWTGLSTVIQRAAREGMAMYGTCAGTILLAKLGLIDITLERNAYGRQLDSFQTNVFFQGKAVPALFIRAPKILRAGSHTEILATHDTLPVLVRERNVLVSTFHPELTLDSRVHQYFLSLCHGRTHTRNEKKPALRA